LHPPDEQQCNTQPLKPAQQAVQCRLVSKTTHNHRLTTGFLADLHTLKVPQAMGRQVALDPDLVSPASRNQYKWL